jgi:hypothetical protein
MVQADQPLDDGEAQPKTAMRSVEVLTGLGEGFEDSRQ